MNILVNDKQLAIESNCSLMEMLKKELSEQSLKGIAVAVNMEIIARELWPGYFLKEDDKILIITATQGG